MSFCREEGQHKVIFVTKEDDAAPISEDINLEFDENDEPEGLIRSDGSINWDCPCLGNMISGPCGVEVRQFFTCFHENNLKEEESKASNCIQEMRGLDKCMSQYPDLYGKSASRKQYDELQADESGTAMLGAPHMDLDIKNGDAVHEMKAGSIERTEGEIEDKKSL